jgi:hypothetical protein
VGSSQENSERKKRQRNKKKKGVLVIKREFIQKQRSPSNAAADTN